MYIYYNPNPLGKQVGDCVIRGISKVTEQSWDNTFLSICSIGYELKDMPSANFVWETYLQRSGFFRTLLPDTCPECYTVLDFCEEHPSGIYLLSTGTHVVAVQNGDYYDAWDSGRESPIYYWQKERRP